MKTSMPKGTDPTSVIDYLIVRGGLAGATAADTLRREGAAGSVAILSAEEIAPYHRPRLSKSYLVGATGGDSTPVAGNAAIYLFAVGEILRQRSGRGGHAGLFHR
jgi:NADPH-dependent 2,4-dienoyl-CoA reductase/sulfur reductase-like enzyme